MFKDRIDRALPFDSVDELLKQLLGWSHTTMPAVASTRSVGGSASGQPRQKYTGPGSPVHRSSVRGGTTTNRLGTQRVMAVADPDDFEDEDTEFAEV